MPKRVLFADIDYTLSDFSHEAGIEGVRRALVADAPQEADFIADYMDRCFHLILEAGKGEISLAARQFVVEVNERGRAVPGWVEGVDLQWSRELWLKEGALQAGITFSPTRIVVLVDEYWNGIKAGTVLYPDVPDLFLWAGRADFRIVLVTSSDARLRALADDSALVYNPIHASEKKLGRIHSFLMQQAAHVVIGDPVGKPHSEFWRRVFSETGFSAAAGDVGAMVGDSYLSDIAPMRELGVTGILLDRSGTRTASDAPLADAVVPSLQLVRELIAPAI